MSEPKSKPADTSAAGKSNLLFSFVAGVAVGVTVCFALYLIWAPRPSSGTHSHATDGEHSETFTVQRDNAPAAIASGPASVAAAKKAAPSPTPNEPAGGTTFSLLPITTEEQPDEQSIKRFFLHIPIKARPSSRIDVNDMVMHILFYDLVDGETVVQTSANVNFHWANPPANWVKKDTEELAVEYQLPKPKQGALKREDRKYYGYIVRVYYRQQLQAAAAVPDRLRQQYPPPQTLPKQTDR
jgi:hypothetical protein